MEIKIKITYLEFFSSNKVMAKIVNIWGWSNLGNKLTELQINDNQVIRIERVLVADSDNIETV
jgi:hypothetical protein